METSSTSDGNKEVEPLDPGDASELEEEAAKYHNPDCSSFNNLHLSLRKGTRKAETPQSRILLVVQKAREQREKLMLFP